MKFSALLLATLFLITACTSRPIKKNPEGSNELARREFNAIQSDIARNRRVSALNKLNGFVKKYPNTDLTDDAYFLLGNLYYEQRDFAKAYDHYISIVNSDIFSPREAEAALQAGRCLERLGRLDEASSLADKGLSYPTATPETLLGLQQLKFQVHASLGDNLSATRSLAFLSEKSLTAEEREHYRSKARDFIESRLKQSELESIGRDPAAQAIWPITFFRLGHGAVEEKRYSAAKDYFRKVIQLEPQSEIGERSQQMLRQLEARDEVSPYTIGAVLPLSGKNAPIGQKALHGIQMALGVFGKTSSRFKLAVVDSEGNPEVAKKAVEKLVMDDHVIAIIGSVLSRTADAVAQRANDFGVPSIALSQKHDVTQLGDTIFQNSLTSALQVQQIVKLAMEQYNLKSFAILFPNDPYGVEFANLFWDEVKEHGGQIKAAQPYNTGETDFRAPVQRLVGLFYVEERSDEYKIRLEDWKKQQTKVSRKDHPPEDLLPAITDFEGLFIPDSVKAVGQIAPMLAYNGVRNVKLFGPNLWNTKGLVERGQKFVEGSVFVDSLAADPRFLQSKFAIEYKEMFAEDPTMMSALGYDSAIILREAIEDGEKTRIGVMSYLSRLQNFPGVLGPITTGSQREMTRPLVSLTVQDGQIVPINSTNQ